jgi:two-component system response regulator FixJ
MPSSTSRCGGVARVNVWLLLHYREPCRCASPIPIADVLNGLAAGAILLAGLSFMSNEANVFIVDGDAPSRDAIASLARARGLRAEAWSSTDEFLRRYDDQPGCLVVDLGMAQDAQPDLQEELQRREWRLPVIAITGRANTAAVVRAMRQGAVTVLDKPFQAEELAAAVSTALSLDAERRDRDEELARVRARFASLSEKERDVLRMIVAGRPNKAMANALGASLRTIENRRREVFSKLGVRSVAELVTLALRVNGGEVS